MNVPQVFTLKIGGQAGQGIKSSGLLFARFMGRSGYHIYNYIEYPSIIRGGHNVMQINVSNEPVLGPSNKTDFLLALNLETLDIHKGEFTDGAGVIYDDRYDVDISMVDDHCNLYPMPLLNMAKELEGPPILINTIALGAVAALLGGDVQIMKNLIAEEFEDKDASVTEINHKAAQMGYDYAKENFSDKCTDKLKSIDEITTTIPKMIVTGNEAAALGAITAGVQFAAIYPMSPISNILHVLAKYQEEYGFVYKQPESEISAINMALGASHAGARAMTATSGGGFCLMSEGYGLAGITETPIVIIEGMRGGPATGIPTWSEQGDLRFVLHAHQSDFPRIVLTPGDPEEVFYMTMDAFNLAEKYQTPVVVLIDKNICENDQSFLRFNTSNYEVDRGKYTREEVPDYKRFAPSDDGISLRSSPGYGNFFIANSDEHDYEGYSSEEISDRNTQMQKRMQKLITCANQDMPEPKLYGPENADLTFISWGSNKGSILQAMKYFDNVNYLHLTWANPFPSEKVGQVLEHAKYVVNVECNYTAQMGGIIAEQTGIKIQDNLLKYDGRPFYVEEIVQKVNDVLKGGAQ